MVCRRAVLKLALGLSLTSVTSPAYAEGTPAREPLPTTTADLVARLRGDVEGRRFIGDIGFGVNGQLEVPGFGQVEVPTLCGVDQGVGSSPPRR